MLGDECSPTNAPRAAATAARPRPAPRRCMLRCCCCSCCRRRRRRRAHPHATRTLHYTPPAAAHNCGCRQPAAAAVAHTRHSRPDCCCPKKSNTPRLQQARDGSTNGETHRTRVSSVEAMTEARLDARSLLRARVCCPAPLLPAASAPAHLWQRARAHAARLTGPRRACRWTGSSAPRWA